LGASCEFGFSFKPIAIMTAARLGARVPDGNPERLPATTVIPALLVGATRVLARQTLHPRVSAIGRKRCADLIATAQPGIRRSRF